MKKKFAAYGDFEICIIPRLRCSCMNYGFQLFLQDLVATIIWVVSLVLQGVVQSHGPKLNGWGVVEIVLC